MTHASFTRIGGKYKPQPTVLVICEDSKSGKAYLEDADQTGELNPSTTLHLLLDKFEALGKLQPV